MERFVVHELPGSPNSIKVRLALSWKGLPFEVVDGDTPDRRDIVALSGQPLLPILRHGPRVVYDSCAIVRYLDVHQRERPLFDPDRGRMGQIECWELFARTRLAEMMRTIVRQYFAPAPDPGELARANLLLSEAAVDIERALLVTGCNLMGPEMNAADLTVAPFAAYGALDPAREVQPVRAFFARHLRLPPSFERTRGWIGRVMAIERPPAVAA